MTDHPWEIAPAELASALNQDTPPLLIDCRTDDELAVARVEAALHVPMSDIKTRLPELEEHLEEPVVVMCHHGVRSLQVVAFLREAGFTDARSLAGGIDRWSHEIDPTVPRY